MISSFRNTDQLGRKRKYGKRDYLFSSTLGDTGIHESFNTIADRYTAKTKAMSKLQGLIVSAGTP